MRKELIGLIKRTSRRLMNICYEPVKVIIAGKHQFQITYCYSNSKLKWILKIVYLKNVSLPKEMAEKLFYKIIRLHNENYAIRSY
jgi:hypothetical protein